MQKAVAAELVRRQVAVGDNEAGGADRWHPAVDRPAANLTDALDHPVDPLDSVPISDHQLIQPRNAVSSSRMAGLPPLFSLVSSSGSLLLSA